MLGCNIFLVLPELSCAAEIKQQCTHTSAYLHLYKYVCVFLYFICLPAYTYWYTCRLYSVIVYILQLWCFTCVDQQFVGFGGNWIEIAYGTSAGTVCIIVQHPETLGQGPQLFQTFSVHCSPVIRVMIAEKHLVSGICWRSFYAFKVSFICSVVGCFNTDFFCYWFGMFCDWRYIFLKFEFWVIVFECN